MKSKKIIKERLPSLNKLCLSLSSPPKMRIILVGDNSASLSYIGHKEKMCKKIGAELELIKLPIDTDKKAFLNEIHRLNKDKSINGGFVQLPLPKHLQDIDTTELISPEKDIDGFGKDSWVGIIKNDESRGFIPCTPKGILTLLEDFNVVIAGKNITIIGRSLIVGKPISFLLQNRGATVTMCHSKTKNIKDHTKSADIIISAVGNKNFLTKEYFKNDNTQVLIDVGINRDEDNNLCGDIDFENVKDHVKSITPVPGGVGPMTVFSLMENLILATQKQQEHQ